MKLKLAKHALNKTKGPLTKREAKHERDETEKAVKKIVRGEGKTSKQKAAVKKELELIKARINKTHGAGSMYLASEMRQDIRKVTTGIVGLDVALLGGLALSRINEKAGKFGVGKTTSDYKSHAAFLNVVYPENGVSLIVNTEKEADTTHMASNGMDLDRTFVSMPDFGDDAGDLTADMIQEIYASEILKIMVSIDSVATLLPKSTQDKTLSKSNMGKQPNLVTRVLQKLIVCMKADALHPDPKSTVSLLNQIRVDIGQMFGDPTIIPGGEGKKHWCSQIIMLKSFARIGEKIKVGKGDNAYDFTEVHSTKGKYTILKNKCHGAQNASGDFRYFSKAMSGYPGGAFDNADQLLNLSLAFRTAELVPGKKGTTSIMFQDGTTLSSQKAALEKLKMDAGFFKDIYEILLEKRYNDFWNRGTGEVYGETVEEEDEDDGAEFFKTVK